jgi:hypothetical protein
MNPKSRRLTMVWDAFLVWFLSCSLFLVGFKSAFPRLYDDYPKLFAVVAYLFSLSLSGWHIKREYFRRQKRDEER